MIYEASELYLLKSPCQRGHEVEADRVPTGNEGAFRSEKEAAAGLRAWLRHIRLEQGAPVNPSSTGRVSACGSPRDLAATAVFLFFPSL